MNFGKRLCFLRKKSGKTQKQLEAATGIPQRTLSDWENNKAEPGVSDAVKLAKALGISIVELIEESKEKEVPLCRSYSQRKNL